MHLDFLLNEYESTQKMDGRSVQGRVEAYQPSTRPWFRVPRESESFDFFVPKFVKDFFLTES